jgi:S1-C subfamily serine protease
VPTDDDDAEDAYGAPLPPEDRLWRHPSEMGSTEGTVPQIVLVSKSGPALGRMLLVAGLAGIIGAAVTLGVIVGTDAFVRERPSASPVEKQAVDVPLVTGKTELAIASVVLPSVARVEASGGPHGVVNSTAVVFRSDGHLITTADAVDAAETITVYLNDGSKLPAQLVNRSIEHDIAVLKVDRTDLPVAVLSQQRVEFADRPIMVDSSNASRGAEINIGVVTKESTPFVREGEATIYGLIQTTTRASVGARSAGSLLIDEGGAVIGMVTSRAEGLRAPTAPAGATGEAGTAPEEANELHYAIPADFVWDIAGQLTDTGQIVKPSLGIISGTDLTPKEAQQRDLLAGGVWVGTLEDGGPAKQVGKLKAGDIIVGIDDTNISGYNDLVVATRRLKPGSQAKLVYVRGGETYNPIVTVAGTVELP